MATLAQQRLAVPVTKTAMSMTDARRQLAAKPRSYGLAPQPGVMQPPTPQMRNTAGQMGPAVGLPQQQGQQHAIEQRGFATPPGQMNPSQRQQQRGMHSLAQQRQQTEPNAQVDFLKKQQFEQQQVNQRRMFDLKMDQERQKAQQAMFQQQMFQEQGMNSRDTVPAMLSPGERVLTPQETMAFHQSPYAPQILGVDGGPTLQQQLMAQQRIQQGQIGVGFNGAFAPANIYNPAAGQYGLSGVRGFAQGGIVPLYYAEGGLVPTTGITGTALQPQINPGMQGGNPSLVGSDLQAAFARQRQIAGSAQLPDSRFDPATQGGVVGGVKPASTTTPPTVGPGPAQLEPYRTDWAGLRQEIGAFGQAPTLDDSTMARMRAIESQKLGNLYRGQLSELGASAASSGAGLYGGDLAGIAAGFAAQRGQQEAELGLKYNVAALDQKREDFYKMFGAAQSLAMQRETQNFSKEEAELDRRWRSGEALSDREWKTLEAARDRVQQTSERIGSQLFTADESQKQRALITDENAKDRLSQMALAEKNIAAQKAALDAQLAQARSENNLDRVQQLTVQRNDLDQQDQQLRQQNDQYLLDFGLRRDVFDRGMVEFDLTRGDQVGQFAQNLDLQNRQLTESGRVADMDDATVRYVANLKDRLERDINAAVIDPSNLQTLLSTIGSIAAIPGLGELVFGEGGLVREGLDTLFGGSDATASELEKLKDAAGGATGGTDWWRDSSGGLSTPVQAAVGAAAAYALFDTFNDPKGFGRTAQAIASGAALGSVLPGIGTVVGAVGGAIVGGLSSAFGPSARKVSQTEFTTQFDEMYRKLQSGGALTQDASNPESLIQPQNRYGLALSFQQAWQEYAKAGVGNIEVSGPDINRMQQLGLVAQVGGGGGAAKAFLIDDPRVLALAGGGDITKYLDISTSDKMVDRTHENTGGSLATLIAGGTVILRDKITGEVIDLNNAEQLKAIAARNLGTAAPTTTSPTTTPPKQAVA